MLALSQPRCTVAAARRGSTMRLALPVRSGGPRGLPSAPVSPARMTLRKAYDNGSGGVDPEVQAKLDEFQGKLSKWWDEIEDKPTFFLYVGVAVFGLTVANQFLNAVERVPLMPTLLKLVGLVYSSWFTYKYLLFAEGRGQLSKDFDKLKDGIAGSVKKSSSSSKVDRDLSDAVSSLKAKAADTTSDFSKTYNRK